MTEPNADNSPTVRERPLTLSEASEYAGLRPKTLLNAVSKGELKSIGVGRRRRFWIADIIDYLKKGDADDPIRKETTRCTDVENHTKTRRPGGGSPSGTLAKRGNGRGRRTQRKVTWRQTSTIPSASTTESQDPKALRIVK